MQNLKCLFPNYVSSYCTSFIFQITASNLKQQLFTEMRTSHQAPGAQLGTWASATFLSCLAYNEIKSLILKRGSTFFQDGWRKNYYLGPLFLNDKCQSNKPKLHCKCASNKNNPWMKKVCCHVENSMHKYELSKGRLASNIKHELSKARN